VGKALAADTLWGNTAKAVITLDETFTSVALVPEKSESLIQNYPNPFNTTTTIRYKVTEPGFVSLKVLDAMGTAVATLINEKKSQGDYSIDWNASGLTSGIYFCRLQTGKFTDTKKLVLQK
jgi:ABC-type Fe3+ transport system substrate-binding protein